jgi:ribosomal protein S18 acetylase RimI-like enzyme
MNERMIDKIMPLEKEKWQGHLLEFRYTSHNYYDVEIARTNDGFQVSFVKKPFDTPFVMTRHDSDRLFQPWWDDVKAWGIVQEGKLIAAIETASENWNSRLRVTELWVHENHRRKGIAKALMDKAIQRAKDEKRRALVLETQSRNEGAIDFYLNYGFSLMGFDACAYQNNDLDRKEVRMEFGLLIIETKTR